MSPGPPSLSATAAAEPRRQSRHSQRWEYRLAESGGDGASQGGWFGHRDPARMVVPLIYGSARLNFPRPGDRHGGADVRWCAHPRHQAHRDGSSGARSCSARTTAQTKEALRGLPPPRQTSSRRHGGDRHAQPSTHPLPSTAQIRISRSVGSALPPGGAPASRPREPGRSCGQSQAWGFQRAVCSIDRLPNPTATAL